MTLKQFLQEHRLRPSWFARMIQTDKKNVYRWIDDGVIPVPKMISKIARYTSNAVLPADWYPDVKAVEDSE